MPYRRNYKKQPAKKTISEAQVKRMIKAAAPIRRKRVMKGKGSYSFQKEGANVGASVGGGIGYVLDKWLGNGDYHVQSNTLIKPSSVPIMHSADSSVRICHKEFVCDITASPQFSSQSFSINPALSASFPYLSGIAQNFESYRIHGMVWTFKSTSADALNSTNTALGSMILATDYNVLDSPFTTKAGYLATTFSNSGKPAQDILHPIECASHVSSGPEQRYTRYGNPPSGSDLRLYDWGNFQIASVGQQATSVVGELYVSYDIELINPQLTIARGLALINNISQIDVTTVSATNPLGTSGTIVSNTLQVTIAGTLLTIPKGATGNYMLCINYSGGSPSTTATNIDASNLVNMSGLNIFNNGASDNTGTSLGSMVVSNQLGWRFAFSITNPQLDSSLVLTNQGGTGPVVLPNSLSAVDFALIKINGNIK